MEYQMKYPLTGRGKDYLLLNWERGYRNVQVIHQGRLITTIDNPAKIKNGVSFEDTDLGTIQLKFSENPMAINVVVDGLHSPANRSHPFKELKKFAWIFWVLAVFGLISSVFEVAAFSWLPQVQLIVLFIDLIIVSAYTVAAIYVAKAQPWAFWIGSITFTIIFIITFTTSVITFNGLAFWLSLILRGAVLIAILMMIRTVISAHKHRRYTKSLADLNIDLLDEGI
jgi:hypothetical protein